MIPTQSTRLPAHIYYADMYDKAQRDPIVTESNRATVPLGRRWHRMNAGVELTWINDAEGIPRAITPKQKAVLQLAMEMVNGQGMTMHEMGRQLNVAASTVYRALTKLQAWGIIAYIAGRGRYSGLVIIRRVREDGLDRFRKLAKERVKRWSEAAQRRLSRLQDNVASYVLEGGRRGDSLSDYVLVTKAATMKPWTPEDMRDLDREMGCL